MERLRKKLNQVFQNEGLKITTEANTTVIDYLDVVMDLSDGSYRPLNKTNANTKYVSFQSNHPPMILKNIPESINKRLSSISSSKAMFMSEVDHYQKALEEAGYKEKLEYLDNMEVEAEQGIESRK